MLAALILVLLDVAGAAAHAELTASRPAADATVSGPLADPIVLTFSEAVADGSKFEVAAPDGSTVGTGGVDPTDATKVSWTPTAPLAAGVYQVRWTSIADDGHVERGTFQFTVAVAATPSASVTPTDNPTASAPPSPAAPAAPAATASAAPSPSGDTTDPAGTSGNVLVPIAAALVIIAGLGAYLLRRRGAAGR